MTYLSEEERQRIQAAADASISDPFDRPLTDEARAGADQAWRQWEEDRLNQVRRAIRQEQIEQQKERDRQAHLLSLPRWRPR
jgi:hypothetical protein